MNSFPKLTFTVQIFKEGRQFVSFNPELRVASCGKTVEIARENLKDAIRGFLLSARKKGTFSEILEEAGFVRQKKSWRDPYMVSLGRLTLSA
jgi:predicted RNase H-like HicB family nuclease